MSVKCKFAIVSLVLTGMIGVGSNAHAACRDPWITELAPQVWGHPVRGSGETGECNINLYGHKWSSKDQLRNQMQQAKRALDTAGIEFDAANPNMIHDIKFSTRLLLSGNPIGTKGSVPAKNWMIDLPNNYVFAVERRCRPGHSANGPIASSGCVKGGVN